MNNITSPRTTIALKIETKKRLDICRAPGQCYDGFISQMLNNWEQDADRYYMRSARGIQGAIKIAPAQSLKSSSPLP